ncbi:unnamed protein product, partial [Ectocarpus fasciculatus]
MTPEAGVRRARRHSCVAFIALCACLLWRSPPACGFHVAAPRISNGRGHERRATLPPRLALGRTHQARRRRAGAIVREEDGRSPRGRREWPLLAERVDGDGHGPEQSQQPAEVRRAAATATSAPPLAPRRYVG